MHVGSLSRGGWENFPAHAQHAILGIWQEAHDAVLHKKLPTFLWENAVVLHKIVQI